HVDQSLRGRSRGRDGFDRRRPRPRLPDRPLRAHGPAGRWGADCGLTAEDEAGSAHRACARGGRGDRTRGGGLIMGNTFHQLDDLVLQLKGLVLVRKLREQRGADTDELTMYGTEIERVRDRLAELVQAGRADHAAA